MGYVLSTPLRGFKKLTTRYASEKYSSEGNKLIKTYLLNVTCSILKQENFEQIQAFLKYHKNEVAVPFDDKQTNWGIEQTVGRQCLPLDGNDGDGFYYALLRKKG